MNLKASKKEMIYFFKIYSKSFAKWKCTYKILTYFVQVEWVKNPHKLGKIIGAYDKKTNMTSLKTQKAIKLSNSKAHKRIQNYPIFTASEWHTIKSMMP